MRRSLLSLITSAMLVACVGATTPMPVKQLAIVRMHGPWSYEVTAAPHGTSLAVEAQFPAGTPTDFGVGEGGGPFVSEVAILHGDRRTAVAGHDGHWLLEACAAGCRVSYTFALRAAGVASNERSVAETHGDVVEAPPSVWLLRPLDAAAGSPFRFHVTSPPGEAFATGVFPVAGVPDTYEGRTVEPFDLPYAAFGPLRRVPFARGRVEVGYLPGTFRDEGAVASWVERSASAVEAYYGRPPVPHLLILLRAVPGSAIGFGSTMGSSGASIDMAVGKGVTAASLHDDWVLVHEMIHTALPDVARQHHWLEEGLATYVESLVRTRAGLVSSERVWKDWLAGMPKGQPEVGDEGLDRTHTWGRTYWGGALFCLVADVEIRSRTENRRSLDDALRAVLAEGGNISMSWPVERIFDVGDRATGVPVLRDLYARMAPRAERVDLEGLWRRLGVVRRGDSVAFDDTAPLASLRLSMMASPKTSP